MCSAVAESLAAGGHRGEQEADEVEEERVDEAKQVPDDGSTEREGIAVFPHHLNADQTLAERGAGGRLADDVVADAERDQKPEGIAADVDPGICITVTTLGVAAAGHQAEGEPEREEDDHGVEQDRDEPKRDAGVLEGAPTRTHAFGFRVAQLSRDPVRLGERDADLPVQDVEKVDVVPALDRGGNGSLFGVEAIDGNDPAAPVDKDLDGPGRCGENLLHVVRNRHRCPETEVPASRTNLRLHAERKQCGESYSLTTVSLRTVEETC